MHWKMIVDYLSFCDISISGILPSLHLTGSGLWWFSFSAHAQEPTNNIKNNVLQNFDINKYSVKCNFRSSLANIFFHYLKYWIG